MAKRASSIINLDPAMRIIVLYGKERFLIEEHTRRFTNMLEERFGGLEHFSFDGETVQPAIVLDELRSYGLLQKHKLVILDNAEVFLAGSKSAAANEDESTEEASPATSAGGTRRPLMEHYAENPVPDATLLMRATLWRAGKLDKLIAKIGSINECELLADEKAAEWCVKQCAKRFDAVIDHAGAQLLVARLGPELQHLDVELSKLAAMVGPGQAITREVVGESVGLTREEKAWEIQSAIITGNASTMLHKLSNHIAVSTQPPSSTVVPLSWAIIDLMRKLHSAAQLMRNGASPNGVMSQLKLWGAAAGQIIDVARRIDPAAIAQLLHAAIQTDVANKTGLGDPVRSLETLMVKIADTIRMEPRR